MIALDQVDAELAHQHHLLVGLDPFDQDLVATVANQADDIPEHHLPSHIAVQEALDGKAVDWMEHVSDEQYRA